MKHKIRAGLAVMGLLLIGGCFVWRLQSSSFRYFNRASGVVWPAEYTIVSVNRGDGNLNVVVDIRLQDVHMFAEKNHLRSAAGVSIDDYIVPNFMGHPISERHKFLIGSGLKGRVDWVLWLNQGTGRVEIATYHHPEYMVRP